MRQAFFWSAPGSKLFGNHPDTKDPAKLRALLQAYDNAAIKDSFSFNLPLMKLLPPARLLLR